MPDRDDTHSLSTCDEALLSQLGFGPEAALMNDPKLFVDRAFLSALLAEFQSELGPELAGAALFQIGLSHGLRDAELALQSALDTTGGAGAPRAAHVPSLALALGPTAPGFRLSGHWPDVHEAEARLQRIGLSTEPSCHLSAGYTSGWLSITTEREVVAVEVECIATGGTACRFEAREPRAWLDDPRSKQIAGVDLQQGLFPQRAENPAPATQPTPGAPPSPAVEAGDKAVHVWGAVMVLPFTYTEEVLATIEMLGRDSNTRSVRVVVIDLSDAIVDEGFMAAGLEQALETIERWGAETILAGVTSLSEATVEGLEAPFMVTHKDLPDAIAMAFQITDAQRHAL